MAYERMFTPVRPTRASDEVVAQIERAIFGGQFRPGARVPSERKLGDEFGVSRITVRDALRMLEARGLIRVRVGAGGGVFVAETNIDRVADTLGVMIQLNRTKTVDLAEARTVVETAVAELAARRSDDEAVERLEMAVERGRQVLQDHLAHGEAGMDFHILLAEAAGNDLLLATVRAYRDLIARKMNDVHDLRSRRRRQRAHEQVVAAVRKHDPVAARSLMLAHLRDFEERLRQWVERQERSAQA